MSKYNTLQLSYFYVLTSLIFEALKIKVIFATSLEARFFAILWNLQLHKSDWRKTEVIATKGLICLNWLNPSLIIFSIKAEIGEIKLDKLGWTKWFTSKFT